MCRPLVLTWFEAFKSQLALTYFLDAFDEQKVQCFGVLVRKRNVIRLYYRWTPHDKYIDKSPNILIIDLDVRMQYLLTNYLRCNSITSFQFLFRGSVDIPRGKKSATRRSAKLTLRK